MFLIYSSHRLMIVYKNKFVNVLHSDGTMFEFGMSDLKVFFLAYHLLLLGSRLLGSL